MQYTDERKYTTVAAEPFSPPGASGTQIAPERGGCIDDTKHTDVISVLLVDDHALMREGLRQLLTLEHDIQIVGDAVDGIDALQKIRQLRPDVVLMDIHMPVVNGLVVTQHVVQEFPEIARYVALGMSNREIAEKLAYSEKTVKNYLSAIFQKLHLRDRTQVAIFALRHGLLPDENE